MIFFLVFPFAAFVLAMLLTAALTFTLTAEVPALRHTAITAPVAAFLLSPVAIAIAILMWTYSHHMFITEPPFGSTAFWVRYSSAIVLLLAGCAFTAAIAVLACRAIVEFFPPLLSRVFNLRPQLVIQAIVLTSGSLSILVLLTSSVILMYTFRESLPSVVAIAAGGLFAAFLCLRAILRLTTPECYQPKPVPTRLRTLLFREQ